MLDKLSTLVEILPEAIFIWLWALTGMFILIASAWAFVYMVLGPDKGGKR